MKGQHWPLTYQEKHTSEIRNVHHCVNDGMKFTVCDRYCVPGSEREKLTDALKRITPQAVELSSPDWWLHSQFMVSILS